MLIGLRYNDLSLFRRNIEKAVSLLDTGNVDWERKNRLISFRGVYYTLSRNFTAAASYFSEGMPAFQCPELFHVEKYVKYFVITGLLAFSRKDLQEKVIHQPEVISMIGQTPHLKELLNTFYDCKYDRFLYHLGLLSETLQEDKIFSQHATYFCKEMRVKAYNQYISPYRSVNFANMASQFSITQKFLENDLERFISAGKVNAKIDKVSGKIEARRVESRAVQLEKLLTSGDQVVNKIEKIMGAVVYV